MAGGLSVFSFTLCATSSPGDTLASAPHHSNFMRARLRLVKLYQPYFAEYRPVFALLVLTFFHEQSIDVRSTPLLSRTS